MRNGASLRLSKIFALTIIFLLILAEASFGAQLNPPRAPGLSSTIILPALRLGIGQVGL